MTTIKLVKVHYLAEFDSLGCRTFVVVVVIIGTGTSLTLRTGWFDGSRLKDLLKNENNFY
jgi:hypothetical protein